MTSSACRRFRGVGRLGWLQGAAFLAGALGLSLHFASTLRLRPQTPPTDFAAEITPSVAPESTVVASGRDVYPSPVRPVIDDIRSPLSAAAERGDLRTMRLLLDQAEQVGIYTEADRVAAHRVPMMRAAARGHIAVIELLIARGAEVNDSPSGSSALLSACLAPEPRAVRFLLESGANPNSQFGPWRLLPLLRKSEFLGMPTPPSAPKTEIIRMLREAGAVD